MWFEYLLSLSSEIVVLWYVYWSTSTRLRLSALGPTMTWAGHMRRETKPTGGSK